MEEQLIIREAIRGDLPVLLEFEQGIMTSERPFDVTLKDRDAHYYDLAKMMAHENCRIIVAELNGKLVASGFARIDDSEDFLKHSKHAHLGFMYVVPEQRGKGLNRKIVDSLLAWIKTKNINEVRLQVYDKNAAAIKAYEKVGFAKHMVQMRMSLPLS